MAQAKKKMTKPADADLVLDLGDDKHLEVHGESFEFLRKSDTGIVSAAVGLTRAQMDKALETLCEAGVITPPLTAEQKMYELNDWVAKHMPEDTVYGIDVEKDEVQVELAIGVLFDTIAELNVEIERLYPGKKVYFQ